MSKCPKCNDWMMYDTKCGVWYCSNMDCDYEEYDVKPMKKFRKELD